MKLSKDNTRLIGSAGTLRDLVEMMQSRMYWQIEKTIPSTLHVFGRKTVLDVYTPKGRNENVVIVQDKNRYKLYMIL